MALVFGSLLCLAGCDSSFTPEVDLPLSPEAVAERVRMVQEFYQTALEQEQNTPLKLRNLQNHGRQQSCIRGIGR